MFEKVSQLAEQAATNVSRREILWRFGRAALAAAGLVAGLLASTRTARAAGTVRCCVYHCYDVVGPGRVQRYRYRECHADGSACGPGYIGRSGGCSLTSEHLVRDCSFCSN